MQIQDDDQHGLQQVERVLDLVRRIQVHDQLLYPQDSRQLDHRERDEVVTRTLSDGLDDEVKRDGRYQVEPELASQVPERDLLRVHDLLVGMRIAVRHPEPNNDVNEKEAVDDVVGVAKLVEARQRLVLIECNLNRQHKAVVAGEEDDEHVP